MYLSKLRVFAEWAEEQKPPLSLEMLKQSPIRHFLNDMSERINPDTQQPISSATVHGYDRVLKAFLLWLAKEEDYEDRIPQKRARMIEMPRVETKILEVYCDHYSFAVRFLENGGDVYVLSSILNHTSIKITGGYLRAFQGKQALKNSILVFDRLK